MIREERIKLKKLLNQIAKLERHLKSRPRFASFIRREIRELEHLRDVSRQNIKSMCEFLNSANVMESANMCTGLHILADAASQQQ